MFLKWLKMHACFIFLLVIYTYIWRHFLAVKYHSNVWDAEIQIQTMLVYKWYKRYKYIWVFMEVLIKLFILHKDLLRNYLFSCFPSTYEDLWDNSLFSLHRDEAWAKEKKMGSFLSVTRGSAEPPVFLDMFYKGGKKGELPLALVGKGVTFDS